MKASSTTRAPLARLGVMIMCVAGAAGLVAACSQPSPPPAGTPAPATPAPPTSAAPTASPGTSAPATAPESSRPSSPPARPPADPSLVAGRYQPLWPFATLAQVRTWQRGFRAEGHQPWHLDAEQTALSFTRDHLGFRELSVITSHRVSGEHARVGVGYRGEPGARPGTAAVIHLVRYGGGDLAPWEVVGTDDTTFSLTTPRYGGTATSPLRVGGRITGVDESIRVQIRGQSSGRPLGEYCCQAAGGQNRPWSATVSFRDAKDRVLTVIASTGGHITTVERFAITAIRPPRSG